MIHPQPKPAKTIKQVKAKQHRAESAQIQRVRAAVVQRDGDCRLLNKGCGACGGEQEWAHLEAMRRARTRGRPPALRHTTQDTMALCTLHHRHYDAHDFKIIFHDDVLRADGAVTFRWEGGQTYVETWTR